MATSEVRPHIPLNRSSTGDTIAPLTPLGGRVTPTGLKAEAVLFRRRFAAACVTAGATRAALLLLVNRLAADEGHRYLQPLIQGDQVGREAGSDAPQALAEAQGSGGIGGGHSHCLAEGREA